MGLINFKLELPEEICLKYEQLEEFDKQSMNYFIKKQFLKKYFSYEEGIILDTKPKKIQKKDEIFLELMDSYKSLYGNPIPKVKFFTEFIESTMKINYSEYLKILEQLEKESLIFFPKKDHIQDMGCR